MKLKYLWGLLLIAMTVCFALSVQFVERESDATVDMGDLNRRTVTITEKLNESVTNRLAMEQRYDCEIFLRTDVQYQANVNDAVKDFKILMDYEKDGKIFGKVVFAGEKERLAKVYEELKHTILVVFVILFVIVTLVFLWIYSQYIRPFRRLEQFARQVSKGNLDFPLPMTKRNYFGAFTESFDIMREELKQAKQGEYQANLSKKELVAELSHDIKTPVSTIKAICELLLIKCKEELTLEKIVIINQKADMIDTLISNMFQATLAELSVLKIEPREELSIIIPTMFEEINQKDRIHLQNNIPECLLCVDKLRLNQVIDNVVNNSYKYAGTEIDVSFCEKDGGVQIRIADHGEGVPEDEMPLLTEKFYRGKAAKGMDGSGLGMYLSNMFMEGMGGSFSYENEHGFVVILTCIKK